MIATRRSLLVMTLAIGLSIVAGGATPSGLPIAPGGPDLRTALEKGLKARRPVEFDFIATVVEMVDAGTLPKSLVETCFLWARHKRPYPFPYFRQSLLVQAHRMGVQM